MDSVLFLFFLGALIIVIGIRNLKGDVATLHRYHRKRVSEEDLLPFGRKIGTGTVIIGCAVIVALLTILIVRCFWVATHCNYPLGMLVCSGIGAMFIAQMVENIGMCLGLTPVIGLTLPFFSYGGSSILTNYIALGIVSGIKMRSRAQRMSRY